VQNHEEFVNLLHQRTWDKELILWYGTEPKLLPFLVGINVEALDLLDLFTPANLPVEDDEVRMHLSRSLRQYLKSIPRMAATHTALIVRSAGLLARYRVGVQDFYDWYCDDFAMAFLLIEGSCTDGEWPDEVECGPDKLVGYFKDPQIVKRLIEA
jgi:hypothetical protein